MKKSTIEYYKKAVRLAEGASNAISKAREEYEKNCVLAKNALEADLYGKKGYEDRLRELEAERDAQIEDSLSRILTVVDEFDSEMQELGRLDGSAVDSGVIALLDSGIDLDLEEWKSLADKFKDNHTMTRILQDRYNGMRKPGEILPSVRFGQSPKSRSEIFSQFVKTVYHAVECNACPAIAGSGRLKSPTDYHNYLAQASLAGMMPFEGEDFSNLDADFPVETVNGKVENAGGRSSSFSPGDAGFNFGFTPIR